MRFCCRCFIPGCGASGCWWSNWSHNLLFRWFVGLPLSEHAWDATSFAKNRERLLSRRGGAGVLRRGGGGRPGGSGLLHDEHFTVDGTLIEAWKASEKSYQKKPGPPPTERAPGGAARCSRSATPMSRSPTPTRGCIRRAGRRAGSCSTWRMR